jgi:hypothetical protein
MSDPWSLRTECIITWMLCAKRLGVPKFVDRIIAEYVLDNYVLDLRHTFVWQDDWTVTLSVIEDGWRGAYWSSLEDNELKRACFICSRPCTDVIYDPSGPRMETSVGNFTVLCPVHGRQNFIACDHDKKCFLVNDPLPHCGDPKIRGKSCARYTSCFDEQIFYK